ncbi:AEC family transporter [Paenibacillus sp. PK4536]|uniref:AEC family transporter n=1 Tax=Paenibacillus sp. PK4536 TaxID=3024576 RepID=UPI002359AC06|nr:AEC family transporter [Paenibacillus sp. PK4536]WIM39436.1 AEC family transporter [Paenibacillus sp. PK4536]
MIMNLLHTLYQVFLPISLPVIGGILLKRFRNLDSKPIATMSLYVLTPAIVFNTLLHADISLNDIGTTISFSLLSLVLLWAIAIGMSRILKLNKEEQAGLTLISTFTNCVNYGLPLVLLAFGQLGLDKASVYVIGQMIIVNTVGVFFAARSQFSVKQAGLAIFRLPAIYATLIAVILRVTDIALPTALDSGFVMLAAAYSPVALVVLGTQMISVGSTSATVTANQTTQSSNRAFWAGLSIRLLVAPLLSWLLLTWLQVEGILFSVLLILTSMPTAVNAVILAGQFNAAPKLVSRCILWTTLASFILMPVLIVWLQS